MSLGSTHRNGSTTVQIVLVDDESDIFSQIADALRSADMLSLIGFMRVDDLSEFEGNAHFLILDNFFGPRDLLTSRRINDLLDIVRNRWPTAGVIVLSHYADKFRDISGDEVLACIAKNQFHLRPSHLRSAIIKGLELRDDIAPETRDATIQALNRQTETEMVAEDPNSQGLLIDNISIGHVTYMLRRHVRVLDDENTYTIEELKDHIVGRGRHHEAAKISFARRVHEEFQRLQKLRKRFYTESDTDSCRRLSDLIDVEKYEANRIVTVPHQIGMIGEGDPDEPEKRRIVWASSDSTDDKKSGDLVSIEDLPYGLMGLKEGDWFQAIVQRSYQDNALVEIVHGTPIDRPVFSQQERTAFWNEP